MTSGTNIAGWDIKKKAILKQLALTVPVVVKNATDDIRKKVDNNLSGSRYLPGNLPVRAVTSTLKRSMKSKQFSKFIIAVYSDDNIASYNKYVHWGTRKMLPRRFLSDAVTERRPAVENNMRYTIIKAIRAVGQ